jgi:hypothetical protein
MQSTPVYKGKAYAAVFTAIFRVFPASNIVYVCDPFLFFVSVVGCVSV